MKTCNTCRRLLPLTNFGKMSASADGKHTSCKRCVNRATQRRKGKVSAYEEPAPTLADVHRIERQGQARTAAALRQLTRTTDAARPARKNAAAGSASPPPGVLLV